MHPERIFVFVLALTATSACNGEAKEKRDYSAKARVLPKTGDVWGRDLANGLALNEWELCQELGQTPAGVALAWVLHNPAVTSPIIGPRTLEQLEQSVKTLELTLSQETLSTLDGIWPGPGNQAPEAYAW